MIFLYYICRVFYRNDMGKINIEDSSPQATKFIAYVRTLPVAKVKKRSKAESEFNPYETSTVHLPTDALLSLFWIYKTVSVQTAYTKYATVQTNKSYSY